MIDEAVEKTLEYTDKAVAKAMEIIEDIVYFVSALCGFFFILFIVFLVAVTGYLKKYSDELRRKENDRT